MASFFSNTVTRCPALFNRSAAESPAGPEPITATFFPVLVLGGFAVTKPSSNACSTVAHSFSRIVTDSLCISSTHDFSHGAGHTRPVNSGKLFEECNIRYASL